MRVLIACEFSGIVREAFRRKGHDAWSCDLLSTEMPGQHLQENVSRALFRGWELMIAHPPCTYLSVSGQHWNHRIEGRLKEVEMALQFVQALMDAPIPYIALENPVGIISTRIRKPDQIIQPYEYGHDASKKTCFWLKNLPPLQPTHHVAPRMVNGKPRWANQTDSGQNRLPPSEHRWKDRSRTYEGIAEAMAEQWGNL